MLGNMNTMVFGVTTEGANSFHEQPKDGNVVEDNHAFSCKR
jgi:hypothetical protein